jgi:hypothetical protein
VFSLIWSSRAPLLVYASLSACKVLTLENAMHVTYPARMKIFMSFSDFGIAGRLQV